jgi:hypothetical protein
MIEIVKDLIIILFYVAIESKKLACIRKISIINDYNK